MRRSRRDPEQVFSASVMARASVTAGRATQQSIGIVVPIHGTTRGTTRKNARTLRPVYDTPPQKIRLYSNTAISVLSTRGLGSSICNADCNSRRHSPRKISSVTKHTAEIA